MGKKFDVDKLLASASRQQDRHKAAVLHSRLKAVERTGKYIVASGKGIATVKPSAAKVSQMRTEMADLERRSDTRAAQPATRSSTPIADQASGKNREANLREDGLRRQFRENQLRQQFRNSKFGQQQMKQHGGGGGDQPRDEQGRWTDA